MLRQTLMYEMIEFYLTKLRNRNVWPAVCFFTCVSVCPGVCFATCVSVCPRLWRLYWGGERNRRLLWQCWGNSSLLNTRLDSRTLVCYTHIHLSAKTWKLHNQSKNYNNINHILSLFFYTNRFFRELIIVHPFWNPSLYQFHKYLILT